MFICFVRICLSLVVIHYRAARSQWALILVLLSFQYCQNLTSQCRAQSLNLSLGALVLPNVNFSVYCQNFGCTAENFRSIYFKRKGKSLTVPRIYVIKDKLNIHRCKENNVTLLFRTWLCYSYITFTIIAWSYMYCLTLY